MIAIVIDSYHLLNIHFAVDFFLSDSHACSQYSQTRQGGCCEWPRSTLGDCAQDCNGENFLTNILTPRVPITAQSPKRKGEAGQS